MRRCGRSGRSDSPVCAVRGVSGPRCREASPPGSGPNRVHRAHRTARTGEPGRARGRSGGVAGRESGGRLSRRATGRGRDGRRRAARAGPSGGAGAEVRQDLIDHGGLRDERHDPHPARRDRGSRERVAGPDSLPRLCGAHVVQDPVHLQEGRRRIEAVGCWMGVADSSEPMAFSRSRGGGERSWQACLSPSASNRALQTYMQYYNATRLHSSLNYLSPLAFEQCAA